MGHPSTTTSMFGNTTSSPSVRKAGTYRLVLDVDSHGTATCIAYRNDRCVTRVRAASHSTALTEARRNVRNARKAGGL